MKEPIMKKNTKKILIFVLALVIVVAVIACIMLFFDGSDKGNEVSPTPSASPSETITPSPSETPVSPSEEPSPSDTPAVTEETADGTKYTVIAPGSEISYSVTIDSSLYEYKREDEKDIFADKSAGDGSVFLEIYRTEGEKAETIAPGFLDQYIKYTEFDYSGVNYLSDEVYGETVMANDGKTQVEAWLIDTESGILAVVIQYNLEDAAVQKTHLYDVLATMVLN
jgi:hypothetical protein